MQTNFDTWLQTLAAGGKGAPDLQLKTATRGLAWEDIIELSGDWSDAVIEGSLSASPDATPALATVIVGGGIYDSVADVTTFEVSLVSGTGGNSTGSLPSDTDGDGVEYFPIAFYMTPSGGSKELLFGAAFPLTGKV